MRRKRWRLVIILPALLCALSLATGCAIAEFGKARVDPFKIDMPSGLVGQDKGSIMKTLGNPDYVLNDANIEYWGYRNHNGWYVYPIYFSFGKIEAKDLILEFANNKVKSSYMIEKGSSIGIFAAPMSVTN